jgi:hypothetical protein
LVSGSLRVFAIGLWAGAPITVEIIKNGVFCRYPVPAKFDAPDFTLTDKQPQVTGREPAALCGIRKRQELIEFRLRPALWGVSSHIFPSIVLN